MDHPPLPGRLAKTLPPTKATKGEVRLVNARTARERAAQAWGADRLAECPRGDAPADQHDATPPEAC